MNLPFMALALACLIAMSGCTKSDAELRSIERQNTARLAHDAEERNAQRTFEQEENARARVHLQTLHGMDLAAQAQESEKSRHVWSAVTKFGAVVLAIAASIWAGMGTYAYMMRQKYLKEFRMHEVTEEVRRKTEMAKLVFENWPQLTEAQQSQFLLTHGGTTREG